MSRTKTWISVTGLNPEVATRTTLNHKLLLSDKYKRAKSSIREKGTAGSSEGLGL